MPEVSTYDPKKVTVSIGGRVITGFAADGVVTLTHNEDAVTPSVGAKGDVAYSENANNSGNAALPLMSTSSSLAYLRETEHLFLLHCVRQQWYFVNKVGFTKGTPDEFRAFISERIGG